MSDDALRKRRDFATKIGALPQAGQAQARDCATPDARPTGEETTGKIQGSLKMGFHTACRLRLDDGLRPERTKQETVMVDAVAARTAPSPYELPHSAPSAGVPAPDRANASPVAMTSATPDRDEAVILDLSDQARTAMAQGSAAAQTPGAGIDDPAEPSWVEKRLKLMTEYTALQQELVWLSDRTMAHALDEMFQGNVAPQGESGATDKQEQFDRDMQRREELMPRYAELIRMLGASPGQESTDESS
ncbi:hypothetical protein ACWIGM_02260 [Bosea sp. NPDC055332]